MKLLSQAVVGGLMLGGLVLGLPSGEFASESARAEEKKGKVKEQVQTDLLYGSFKKKRWNETIKAFNYLVKHHEAQSNKVFLYMAAQAHFNLKKWDSAKAVLDALLDLQEDHIGALYLKAKILAKAKKPDKKQIQSLLIDSAEAGQFVLRDISGGTDKATFTKFVKDPAFILSVMQASRKFTVSTGLRNPFLSPLREQAQNSGEKTPTTTEAPVVNKRLIELEARVESLFKEIAKLAADREVEELISKFRDLREIMAEYGQEGSDVVKSKLEKWNKRLQNFGEVQLSIQLQIYIQEGNQHLRAMADAIKRDEYDLALTTFERVKELKAQMYQEERDVFHRNADVLFLRAKALAERAARLKKISEFTLKITGIVVAPPAGAGDDQQRNSCIIDDRIYRENDTIIDVDTEEEIEGLQVVEISRSTVKFRYQDTDFIRELQTP